MVSEFDKMTTKDKLVLGIGNDILMDDGIGPRLVQDLENSNPLPGVEYRTTTLGGLEILESIQGYHTVIFVDAIKTRGGEVGTVYEFSTEDFKETLHLSNLHDVSFLTALELGKQIGLSIPSVTRIIAIEILEDLVFDDRFTPELQAAYPRIRREVTSALESYLRD
jgi:hydrogenase maturation protease